MEFERNRERYQFLRWGQRAFADFKVVPPGTGICTRSTSSTSPASSSSTTTGVAYPDTLVGTDSHTTMVNGLGVLGWGVGGIEAEAAMLGQPISMLIPRVVGFKLTGECPAGTTATDLVLTVTEMLRRKGVVGKFVEFYGDGVANVPLANRATIGNMSPEYGSTCAIFPIDDETLTYLRFTGRSAEQIALVEAYAKEQGLWHDPAASRATPRLSSSTSRPSCRRSPGRSGRRTGCRCQWRRPVFRTALRDYDGRTGSRTARRRGLEESFPASDPAAAYENKATDAPVVCSNVGEVGDRASDPVRSTLEDGTVCEIDHGAVVIAAITSCTNTSNPQVMIGAALVAKNAVEKGLSRKPWVKTTLAPGSKVVTDYYDAAGLTPYLDKLGFNLVGYGCTTCIGNSGPLRRRSPPASTKATSPSCQCSRATATSRAASTPT